MKCLLWIVLVIQLAIPLSVTAQESTAPALADSYIYDRNTIRLSDIPKDAPKFEDYPVEFVFKGKIAVPDVRSHPRSKRFRTVIRKRAKAGVNFAGHYTLMAWGCGTGCASWAIVDAQTGNMFHPENFQTSGIYNISDDLFTPDAVMVQYHANSKLLIVIGGINEDPTLRGISYFVWEHNQLKRIRFVPRPNQENGIKNNV